ncbi:hypothetical protein GGI22_006720, partial [Coemansia erecta]
PQDGLLSATAALPAAAADAAAGAAAGATTAAGATAAATTTADKTPAAGQCPCSCCPEAAKVLHPWKGLPGNPDYRPGCLRRRLV